MVDIQNNFFFLPLKEGKGHPKCHMSWLGAKFQWPLSPRAMLSSPAGHRLSDRAPSAALAICTGPQLEGCWQRGLRHRETSRALPEGPNYCVGPEDKDSSEVRKGCWLSINFLRWSTDSKSCLMARDLFVLQSTSCHT